jgi:Type ISP C-terminal specificity domain
VFPLYFETEDMYGKHRLPNFSRPFIDELARNLGIDKRDKTTGLPSGVSAEDILQYLYAVMHSPAYRIRYGELLKIEFPRIPMPKGPAVFHALSKHGESLVALHLLRASNLDTGAPSHVGSRGAEVEKVSFSGNTVWIDKKRTAGFKPVSEPVWSFLVGGYPVCEKWLKDRKRRALSKSDIEQYQHIVVALRETLRLMAKIDEAIEKHGGWPGAFAATAGASS